MKNRFHLITSTKFVNCSFDESLGVVVHRYNTGYYTCRCGKEQTQRPMSPGEKLDKMKAKKKLGIEA